MESEKMKDLIQKIEGTNKIATETINYMQDRMNETNEILKQFIENPDLRIEIQLEETVNKLSKLDERMKTMIELTEHSFMVQKDLDSKLSSLGTISSQFDKFGVRVMQFMEKVSEGLENVCTAIENKEFYSELDSSSLEIDISDSVDFDTSSVENNIEEVSHILESMIESNNSNQKDLSERIKVNTRVLLEIGKLIRFGDAGEPPEGFGEKLKEDDPYKELKKIEDKTNCINDKMTKTLEEHKINA